MTDAPQCLQAMLHAAVERNASDIHLESGKSQHPVRLRIDGTLRAYQTLTTAMHRSVIAHIKVLSRMDTSQQRLPQDGRFSMHINASTVDCRVSTVPAYDGENCVIRLLQQDKQALALSDLALSQQQIDLLLEHAQQPQGMLLLTGPTGSGKSTTLYALLNALKNEQLNILTAEDPIERMINGVNQVNIAPQLGFDFPQALRAFLRQDPDIMVIGEIRDPLSLEIAIKAAQTGHRLLSTLHTHHAIETLFRIKALNQHYLAIWPTLHCIVAQRLCRKLCEHCKQGSIAIGCDACHQGYAGRVALFEILTLSETLYDAFTQGASANQLLELAIASGFQSLQQQACQAIKQGKISLEEAKSVIPNPLDRAWN